MNPPCRVASTVVRVYPVSFLGSQRDSEDGPRKAGHGNDRAARRIPAGSRRFQSKIKVHKTARLLRGRLATQAAHPAA